MHLRATYVRPCYLMFTPVVVAVSQSPVITVDEFGRSEEGSLSPPLPNPSMDPLVGSQFPSQVRKA